MSKLKGSRQERVFKVGNRFCTPAGLAGSTAVRTNRGKQSWRTPQEPQLRQLVQGLGPSLPWVMERRRYCTGGASAAAGTGCIVCKQRERQNRMSCLTKDATRYPKQKKNGLVPLLTFALVQAYSFEMKGCIINVWSLLIWKTWNVHYCLV